MRWYIPALQSISARKEKIGSNITSNNYDKGKYIIQRLSIEMFANTGLRDCDNKWNPLKEGIFICVQKKVYSLNMDVKSNLFTSKFKLKT